MQHLRENRFHFFKTFLDRNSGCTPICLCGRYYCAKESKTAPMSCWKNSALECLIQISLCNFFKVTFSWDTHKAVLDHNNTYNLISNLIGVLFAHYPLNHWQGPLSSRQHTPTRFIHFPANCSHCKFPPTSLFCWVIWQRLTHASNIIFWTAANAMSRGSWKHLEESIICLILYIHEQRDARVILNDKNRGMPSCSPRQQSRSQS